MKRSKRARAKRHFVPIEWLKPTVFEVPITPDEEQRLAALYRYDILGTPPERSFDSITVLGSHVCQTPIVLLVLIDHDSQWFKAKVGVRINETPRKFAFCAHTIMQRALFVIPDARRDKCFAANPLVASGPQYRFYTGVPLVTPDNRALGTLCVIDKVRRALTAGQEKDLRVLSRLVMTELELRRSLREERRMKKPIPGPRSRRSP